MTMTIQDFAFKYPELNGKYTVPEFCQYSELFFVMFSSVAKCAPDTSIILNGLFVAHHIQANSQEDGGLLINLKQSWREGDVNVQNWNGGVFLDSYNLTTYGQRLAQLMKLLNIGGMIVAGTCSDSWHTTGI